MPKALNSIPQSPRISDLTSDPVLAAVFRRAEGDGLATAEVERPKPPRHDGAAARVRVLELA